MQALWIAGCVVVLPWRAHRLRVVSVFGTPPFSAFFFFFLFVLGLASTNALYPVVFVPLGDVLDMLSGPAAVSPVCFIYKSGRKPDSREGWRIVVSDNEKLAGG